MVLPRIGSPWSSKGPGSKGSVFRQGTAPGSTSATFLASIEGTVAGDVFSFRQTNGPVTGETTVSADEMSGEVWFESRVRRIILRRVNSPSRPSLQER
jgi:hypothetical protein